MIRALVLLLLAGVAHAEAVRPEINGTYEPTCREARNCVIDTPGVSVPVWDPGDGFGTGLINVSGDYVTLEGLSLQDSAGNGIASNDTNYLTVKKSNVEIGLGTAIRLGTANTNSLLQTVNANNYVECDRYQSNAAYQACALPGSAGDGSGHVPQISCGSDSTGFIADDVWSYSSYGEGISCVRSPTFGYFVGVVTTNLRTAAILLSESDDMVVDSFLSIAVDDDGLEYGNGNEARSTDENRDLSNTAVDWNETTVFRNVLSFRSEARVVFPGITDPAASAGRTVTQDMYYWGAYDTQSPVSSCSPISDCNPTVHDQKGSDSVITVDNFITYAPDNTDGLGSAPIDCKDNTTGDGDVYTDNTWTQSPLNDTDCSDAGDEFGEPTMSIDLDSRVYSMDNLMTERDTPGNLWDDFDLSSGSIGCNSGTPRTAATLDISNFPRWAEATAFWDKVGATVTEAQWEKLADIDALGRDRDDTNPTKGPLESPGCDT